MSSCMGGQAKLLEKKRISVDASVEVSVSSIMQKVCTILYLPISSSVKKDPYMVLRSDSLSHEVLQQIFFFT